MLIDVRLLVIAIACCVFLLNLKQLQEPFSGRMAKTLAEI
jgi:hypothetical protein